MPSYNTATGKQIDLGPLLGAGGEGNVYLCANDPNVAVKIYHHDKAAERYAKISAMTAARLAHGTFAAFPIEAIFDGGVFAGFTMPAAPKRKPIHEAYSPSSRKSAFPSATFPFLLRVAVNTAIAVNKVHELGCVVGDINHSGVLVARDGTVTLIDADSFQFRASTGKLYPCKVGVPEYTPPELQLEKNLANVVRTENHDNFGLAILIFYLLFLGRHPFAGQVLTGDQPTTPEAIKDFRFAYSARHNETRMAPPPHCATTKDIPLEMADAFESAFGPQGVNRRPTAIEWIKILHKAEGFLQKCTTSKAHDFFKNARACPWCRIERSIPGFFCFNPVLEQYDDSVAINLKDLVSKFRATPPPKLPADLTQQLPNLTCHPNPEIAGAQLLAHRNQKIGLWMAGAGSLGIFLFTGPLPLLCLLLIALGGLMYFGAIRLSADRFKKAAEEAESKWNDYHAKWLSQLDRRKYDQFRKIGEGIVQTAEQLPHEERQKIAAVQQQKREAQMKKFLGTFRIDQAGLRAIGPSRIISLASRQIETAADVDYNRVRYIKGFGPNLAQELVNWRQNLEARFTFNPSAAVDPSEILRVKAEIRRKQSDCLSRLTSVYNSMLREQADLSVKASLPHPSAVALWKDYHQTRANLAEAQRLNVATSQGAFAASVLGPLLFGYLFIAPSLETNPNPQSRQPQRPVPNANLQSPPPEQSSSGSQVATQTQDRTRPSTAQIPRPKNEVVVGGVAGPIDSVLPMPTTSPSGNSSPPSGNSSSPSGTSLLSSGSALPPLPEVVINSAPISTDGASELSIPLDTSDPKVALTVQTRLKELGFLKGAADGKFGPQSRQALEAYQTAIGLLAGPLDALTARSLFSSAAPTATAASIVPVELWGMWDQEPCDAPVKRAQMNMNRDRATAFGATCKFENMMPVGDAFRGSALCTHQGQTWRSEVTLKKQGDVMTWISGRGSMRYYRCVR